MIRIAIDGPGGAGKSSVAKRIARELGIIYVDTGALYRNIGLYVLRAGISPTDAEAVAAVLADIKLELKFEDGKQIILLCGEDMGDKRRTPEVSMAASAVSAIPAVREYLLNMQRDTAKKNSVIMDGRDIGTVILPDAEVKVFLTASPEARAQRRFKELSDKGVETTYEQVYAEMVERDKNDSTRAVAPCVQAEDAVLLDNSRLTEEQTAKKIIKLIKKAEKKQLNPVYRAIKLTMGGAFKFFLNIRTFGLETVPMDGPLLLCSNHVAAVDVFAIAAVCPRQMNFIAKKELFSIPVIGSLIGAAGAIKLDRGGKDIGAIKKAISTLEEGRAVAIFPQGHRYPGVDPATTPVRNGGALIAYRSGCDVLPVCISIKKKGKYALFRRTEIHFGKVIKSSELGFNEGGQDEYGVATEKIFGAIKNLSDLSHLPAYVPETRLEGKKK